MKDDGCVPRLFGTNGVRGIVNSPEMDPVFALRLGLAIGSFMRGTVLIGTDARTSNEMLKSACAAGMMASGCDVRDCGTVPTPALQYAVRLRKAAGGVMITASHNPPEFNGIKCIDPDGTEMSRENEESIERLFQTQEFELAKWTNMGSMEPDARTIDDYIDGIVARVDLDAIREADLRIALDCGNGAGSVASPRLLERLGVRYVTLNANPDGTFPGHNSEPVPENSKDLVDLVRSGGFDFGVIQDGDADRAIFVDDTGAYQYGDRSLALGAYFACQEDPGGLVVTTVGSSKCVEDAVRANGGRIMYTRVGSPVVARAMIENGAVFGGEENGGLIFSGFQYCRDAGMAMARMVEIVAKHGSMSSLLAKIPSYAQYKAKTACPDDQKQIVMRQLAADAEGDRVDTTDGVKVFFEDGWVLVRPSGTEPLFRVFTEAKDAEKAELIAQDYIEKVRALVDRD
jgi:phosphomannomutase/phosphoglucomutase